MEMRKTISVICVGCSKDFFKTKSEVARAEKHGLRHFCSNKCQATYANNGKGNPANLRVGSTGDEFSPFRYFLWKIRARHKKMGFGSTDLTLAHLKELWEAQGGVCPLTGWKLSLPPTLSAWNEHTRTKDTASLDRIRPMEPYSKGNVRFVAHIANMAKHTYTDEDVIDFCKAVTQTRG